MTEIKDGSKPTSSSFWRKIYSAIWIIGLSILAITTVEALVNRGVTSRMAISMGLLSAFSFKIYMRKRKESGVVKTSWIIASLALVYLFALGIAGLVYNRNVSACTEYNTNPDHAIEACSAVIRVAGERSNDGSLALARRGAAYFINKQYELSLQDSNHAIQYNPNNFLAFITRGGSHAEARQYDEALQDFDAVKTSHLVSNNPSLLSMLLALQAAVYFDKGMDDKAFSNIDESFRLNPNSSYAYMFRGLHTVTAGEFDKSIPDLDQAIRFDPSDAVSFQWRGVAKLYSGDLKAALSDFEKSQQLDSSDGNKALWLHLSHVRLKQEDQQELERNATLIPHRRWPLPVLQMYTLFTSQPENPLD
jgi:tetratricopeptide (TPR) repeat protein